VLDFGICKTSSSTDSGTTSPGVVMGSPDYMAPEQGAGLEATVASDVYAVGCIVYEMLAARLPFKGRNAIDVLMQKGAREAERVTSHRPEVPPPLAEVVARCLMRSSQDRPPSMRALEYELTRAVDGRATAVAAVLGLNMEGDSGPQLAADGDPSPAASASFHRAAIAALQTRPAGYEPPERTVIAARPMQEHTQIAPAPVIPPYHSGGVITAAQVRASSYVPLATGRSESDAARRNGMASGAKALAFVVLGGLLASGLLLALSPETFKGLLSGEEARPADQRGMPEDKAAAGKSDAGKSDAGKSDATKADAGKAVPDATTDDSSEAADEGVVLDDATGGSGGVEPTPMDDAGEDAALPEPPRPAGPVTAQELVAQAETALAKNHWREPAEQSMALALANLALVDPGHEALRRLRRAAADELLPLGTKELGRGRWTAASAAFRDLVAVWPDHEEARQQLLEALRNEGRVLAKHDDPKRTLAVAEEILTMEPEDFRAMMLRADSLYALGHYAEAKQAFGRAKRENPRSKAAKKGWWRAHAKAG
jgi:eukaryotic-like serine/threonine-protein kinase